MHWLRASRFEICQGVVLMFNVESFDPEMNADVTLSYWGQKPDVSFSFFVKC